MKSIDGHRLAIRRRLRTANIRPPGPGSVSWRINREIVLVAAWGRAILLQLAHPLVAAGVGDHSRFRDSFAAGVRRLRSTVRAMLSLTFGDDDEVVTAAARINAIHDSVTGRLEAASGRFARGDTYSAHDPELLRWVHATLLDSILVVFQLLVGPLTREARLAAESGLSAHAEP